MRKTLSSILLASTLALNLGCDSQKEHSQKEYITGIVINESRGSGNIKYAFTLKTPEGQLRTFGAYNLISTQIDSKVNEGSTVRIDKDGIRNSSDYGPLIEDIDSVTIIKEADK